MTDDNSNFRHDELQQYQEKSELEEQAEKSGFSLVELEGNIAVIGNGAGLVMSTFDMLSDNGGKPATFLDVGGGATTESVYEALRLISKMKRVKGILVNLYGGIVKTTTVASAFIQAYDNNLIDIPVFARLMGTESDKAKDMLKETKTKMFDSVEKSNKIYAPKDRYYADPFIIKKNEDYFVFIEEVIYQQQKGHISYFKIDKNGNYNLPEKILENKVINDTIQATASKLVGVGDKGEGDLKAAMQNTLLMGDGKCAEYEWRFVFNFAEWAFIFFTFLFFYNAFFLFKGSLKG